ASPREPRPLSRLHLGHEIRAINLDRTRADAEVMGDLLVGVPGNETLEHVALALRQRREPTFDIAALGLARLVLFESVERRSHGCQQDLVVERFFEEIDSADLHR